MSRPSFREKGHEQESAREYADRKAIWIGIQRGDIKPPRPIETIKTVVVREKADLSDTLAKMEAAAARAAQPGANIPPAIKELMDENLTDEQNVEKLRQRWSELTGRNVALASGSQVFEPLTDAERKELTTLNSWDKLRGA